jgi:hypothetical protein
MQILYESLFAALKMCGMTLPVLVATLVITDLLLVTGILSRLFFIVAPIARVARLSESTTLAFMTSIGSTLSADSMTSRLYREKTIGGLEALISAQANGIPGYLRETFTYFLPVIIPLLGPGPGSIYMGTFFLTVLLKMLFVCMAGRRIVSESSDGKTETATSEKSENDVVAMPSWREALGKRLGKTLCMVVRITAVLFAASFVVTLLDSLGYLAILSRPVKPVMTSLGIPERLFIPICTYLARPAAGAAAIGTLYKSGDISFYCTTAAAILGGILSLFFATVRYTLPRNIALFGPRIGGFNAAIGFSLALSSRIASLAAVVLFFRP